MHAKQVIFIHGLMGSPNEWNEPALLFQQHNIETYQICLPAHGDNPDCTLDSPTLDELFEYCAHKITELTSNKPALLVGHSLGAALCVLLAAQYPEQITGLVIMGCPYHLSAYTHPWSLWMHPKGVFKRGKGYLPESLTGFKRPKVTHKDFFRFFTDGRKLFKKIQMAAPKVTIPVWIFHSEYDLHVPYGNMQKLAQALVNSPQVKQYTLTQCGHQVFPKSNEKDSVLKILLSIPG